MTCKKPNSTFRDEYIFRFDVALRAGLRRRREANIDDVAQSEHVVLLSKFGDISSRYLNPEVYAAVRLTAATQNHRRREGKQRGCGTRFAMDEMGRMTQGRTVISGDAQFGEADGFCLFDGLADHRADPADFVPARLDDRRLLDAALVGSSSAEVEMMELSYGYEFTDEEMAMKYHVVRETMNRRKNASVRRVRGRLGLDAV